MRCRSEDAASAQSDEQNDARRDDCLRGVVACPQQQDRRENTREARSYREEKNPPVVAQLH